MSTLRVNTLQTQAGVEVYTAKAWVNFNGTGTVAIRASGNVSSITDNGTGNYTVNFTTAFADANYAACGTANGSGNYGDRQLSATPTSGSACRLYSGVTAAVTLYDADYMMASFFR